MLAITHIHIKSGVGYGMLGNCQVKVNGDWELGVIYMNDAGTMFVRSKENFDLKFEPIDPTIEPLK